MPNAGLQSFANRLTDKKSLKKLFVEGLNFEISQEPVNEETWKDEEKNIIEEAEIVAKKDDYKIYEVNTIQTKLNNNIK